MAGFAKPSFLKAGAAGTAQAKPSFLIGRFLIAPPALHAQSAVSTISISIDNVCIESCRGEVPLP